MNEASVRHCGRSVLLSALIVSLLSPSAATADPDVAQTLHAVLTDPSRPDADRARDRRSRPTEVLTFFGLEPGMTVLDLLAGDGYYSEIAARATGPAGHVYLHNNQGTIGLMPRAMQRLQRSRLKQLEPYVREIHDVNLPSSSVDLVLMVLVYHDLYYENNGWQVPPGPLLRTVFRVLEPGGVLGIVDHAAPEGTGAAFAQSLHRIASDFVITDVERYGFVHEGSSDVLENAEDKLTRAVFDPAVRGNTSRFVLRFVKPG